ncbi:MAG: substrate-binding domain-containing protein [Alphaproteobacteria bacterium]|nr:substrate-binding domain-containing protein [Alphaproteobacteria bacterium]
MFARRALPFLALPAAAQTAPLLVLGTGATEIPIDAIAHAFAGPVRTATGNGGQVAARIRGGEAADVVLNAGAALDTLIRDGLLRAETRRELGHMVLGLAVRAGSPLPALPDEAALAAVLRAAPSIAMSDGAAGATSGRHVLALLDRLGITEPRRMPYPRGLLAVQAVARGKAALVITQASEILAEPGATLAAELPESAQLVTAYVGAVAARAAQPERAAAFLEFAAGPQGAAVFRRAGFRA